MKDTCNPNRRGRIFFRDRMFFSELKSKVFADPSTATTYKAHTPELSGKNNITQMYHQDCYLSIPALVIEFRKESKAKSELPMCVRLSLISLFAITLLTITVGIQQVERN